MMTSERDLPEADDFAQRLARLDEQIAEGDGDLAPSADELDERLAGAVDCLQWLDVIRRDHPETFGELAAPDTGKLAADPTPGAPVDSQAVWQHATTIGRYRIERELGSGGYGVVFLADDPQLSRQVALKVPRPEALVHADSRRRFVREAKAAAALDHPAIVAVHDAGEVGLACFIASAYCPGPSLARWLNKHPEPVPWVDAARMVEQLADGVQHAHSRGVIHRDLKPANVILAPKSKEFEGDSAEAELTHFAPRITDFGLARLLDDAQFDTQQEDLIGTPAYMSPEQAEGRHGEVGPAADVYALGAILYELLTGRPPFQGASVLATLDAVRHEDPQAPRNLRPDLPRDLESICLKCLTKRIEDRYVSAAALAEDLRRLLAFEPVSARPLSMPQRLSRWCRRRPAVAALAASTLITLITLTTISSYAYARVKASSIALQNSVNERDAANQELQAKNQELTRTNRELVQSQQAERQQRERADQNFSRAREAVDEILTQWGYGFGDVPHMNFMQQILLDRAIAFHEQFVEENPDDPYVRLDAARAYERISGIHHRRQQSELADEFMAKAIQLLEADPPSSSQGQLEYDKTRTSCQLNSGLAHLAERELELAADAINAAVNSAMDLVDRSPLDIEARLLLANSLAAGARVSLAQQNADQALTVCQEARDGISAYRSVAVADDRDNPRLTEVEADLCLIASQAEQQRGNQTVALEAVKEAYALSQSLQGYRVARPAFERKLGDVLISMAYAWMPLRKVDEAEQAILQALEIARKHDEQYPGLPGTLKRLADCEQALADLYREVQRDFHRGEAASRRAVERFEELVSRMPNNPSYRFGLASALTGLATCHWRQSTRKERQREEVKPILERARSLLDELLANESENADYLSCSGVVNILRSNVSDKLTQQGNRTSEAALQSAFEDLSKSFELKPKRVTRKQLQDAGLLLSIQQVRRAGHENAIATLRKLASLDSEEPANLEYFVIIATLHGNVAGENTRLSEDERVIWRKRYHELAIQVAGRLLKQDPKMFSRLSSHPVIVPHLRSRADFQALLADVESP